MDEAWRTHDLTIAGDALEHLSGEWLLTNGTGAFAMGTVPGINTRRYHGLLIAASKPPVGRVVAVNQVIEQLVLPGASSDEPRVLEFSACAFRDTAGAEVFAPRGYEMLTRFERGLAVRWTYAHEGLVFTRELHLHWKAQAATLRYRVEGLGAQTGGKAATLRLGPLLSLRDFHGLLHRDRAGGFEVKVAGAGWDTATVVHQIYSTLYTPVTTLRVPGGRFRAESDWWYGFHYPIETQRGQSDTEDNFLPGWFELELSPQGLVREATLTMTLGDSTVEPEAGEDGRRRAHLAPIADRLAAPVKPDAATAAAASDRASDELLGNGHAVSLPRMLTLASDDFVVDRALRGKSSTTIIAGYPWFADWGRDTFIALPGLLLATGRFDEARSTLRTFADALRDGLVPNHFDDYDDTAAHYNTVDASLWYVHAAMEYVRLAGDREAWDGWLAAACRAIVDAYIRGTPPAAEGAAPLIRMAGDGLIAAGGPNTQLTWMDAMRNGVVFTPRHGKAVEINALWFHALKGMAELLAPDQKATADHYGKLAARIGRSFPKVFWNDAQGGCYDHVWTDEAGQDHPDASIRPNQIFVASLPHSPLPKKRQARLLGLVRDKLLTPYGLRTLAPDDPKYHPHYTGEMFQRDEAYHQGCVWPWLIGPYAEAVLRVGDFSDAARAEARAALVPLLRRMADDGLGQLAEVHEGAAPHRPDGCPAQAWSVAEVIRVLKLVSG